MSAPGTDHAFPGSDAVLAIADALLDHGVRHCAIDVDTRYDAALLAAGSPRVDAADAQFAFLGPDASVTTLLELRQGDLEDPFGGATAVLIERPAVTSATVLLSGPGIRTSRRVALAGMTEADIAALRATRVEFPLGVDVLIQVAPDRVLALPRSTTVEVA